MRCNGLLKILVIGLYFFTQSVTLISQNDLSSFESKLHTARSFKNVNIDSTIYFANSAYLIAQNTNNNPQKLESLIELVRALLIKGKFSEAIKNCFIADSIIRENGIIDMKGEITMYTGLVYVNSGFISEGLEYLYEAKGSIDQVDDPVLQSELDYYLSLSSIRIGDTQLCIHYARSAISKSFDSRNLKNYIMLSSVFKNIDSIRKYLLLADTASLSSRSYYQRVAFLNNEALFYKDIGEIDLARKNYIEAIRISKSNSYGEFLSNLYNNYAYLLMETKSYDSAYALLTEALAISRDLENIDLEASILDSFSDYYTDINDTISAFEFYKKSVNLKNEYKRQQQLEKSIFLSTVFETEKKEQQLITQQNKLNQAKIISLIVALLFTISVAVLIYFRQKSITKNTKLLSVQHEKKLEVANALIEGQDLERKRLAMDLHDGVNPKIGILKMVIETTYQDINNISKIIERVDEISNDIRELSHKMLPAQLDKQGLVAVIENLVGLVKKSNGSNIKFYSNLSERLNSKLEINLFFLTYEMINNALKHSKAAEIVVQLLLNKNDLILSVEDNGIGFDTSIDFNGHGIKNLKQRVKYLEGNLTIDSRKGEGTELIIEVKI